MYCRIWLGLGLGLGFRSAFHTVVNTGSSLLTLHQGISTQNIKAYSHRALTITLCVTSQYGCCMQFASLHNLQNALQNLARARIRVRVQIRVRIRVSVRIRSKFANCICTISKLCSTFCKSCRLTNRTQHSHRQH